MDLQTCPGCRALSYYAFLILAPVSLVLLGWIGRVGWTRRREVPGARAITGLSVACSWWLVLAFAEMVAPTFALTLWFGRLAYIGIAWVPVAWFAFALSFTGRSAWLRSLPFRLAVAFAGATGVVAVTMPWHGWIWASVESTPYGPFQDYEILVRGWWFWALAGVSWALGTAGSLLVIVTYARSQQTYRQLSAWLALGAALPVVVNVLFVSGLVPFGKDPSPLSFGLGSVAVARGIFRHRFLDLHPISRTSLVESLSEGLVSIDARGRVTDFNPALARLAGPALQIGAPLAEAVPALATAHHQPEGGATFAVGDETLHVEWRAAALSEGDEHGRLVVLRDVTERQIAQDALDVALAELRVQNQDLDAFARTVAHDLKNPVHTIRGYAELLHDDESMTPELRAESAAVILRTADRMNDIIREMLLLASVRQQDVPCEPVDLALVAADVRHRLASVLERHDATVHVPSLWPAVAGHGPWIEEVWANFVSNAAKYGGPSPHIEIGAEADPEGVRLWVQDRGPGLSPSDCARVFLPFTRVGNRQAEGHGLGLAIVARIAEKLGGAAGVQSEPGHGCRFYVVLPAALAVPAEGAPD